LGQCIDAGVNSSDARLRSAEQRHELRERRKKFRVRPEQRERAEKFRQLLPAEQERLKAATASTSGVGLPDRSGGA
jgi:hypothetical protein